MHDLLSQAFGGLFKQDNFYEMARQPPPGLTALGMPRIIVVKKVHGVGEHHEPFYHEKDYQDGELILSYIPDCNPPDDGSSCLDLSDFTGVTAVLSWSARY